MAINCLKGLLPYHLVVVVFYLEHHVTLLHCLRLLCFCHSLCLPWADDFRRWSQDWVDWSTVCLIFIVNAHGRHCPFDLILAIIIEWVWSILRVWVSMLHGLDFRGLKRSAVVFYRVLIRP